MTRRPAKVRRWSDDAIRAALADFWTRTGRPPTTAEVTADGWSGPKASTFRRRYGGTKQAWAILGPVPTQVRRGMSNREIGTGLKAQ
jgi:hypothetical protein